MSPLSAKATRLKAYMFPTMEFDRPPLLKLSKLYQGCPGVLQRIGTETQNGRDLFSEDLDVRQCYYDDFYEDMSGYEAWDSDDTGSGSGSCVYSGNGDMSEHSSTLEVNAIEVSDIESDHDNPSDVHPTTGEMTELYTPADFRNYSVSKATGHEDSRSDNGIGHTDMTSEANTKAAAKSIIVEEGALQKGDASDKDPGFPSSSSPLLLRTTPPTTPDTSFPCSSALPINLVPKHADTAHLEFQIEDEVSGSRALVSETPEYGPSGRLPILISQGPHLGATCVEVKVHNMVSDSPRANLILVVKVKGENSGPYYWRSRAAKYGPAGKLPVDVLPVFRVAVTSLWKSEERDETTGLPSDAPPPTTRELTDFALRGMRGSTSAGPSSLTSDGAPSLLASTSSSIYSQRLEEPIQPDNHPDWHPSDKVQDDTAAEVKINPAGRWLLDMLACDKWKNAFHTWGELHLANCSHFECQALHELGMNPCSYLIPSCAAFRRGLMATLILHIEICQDCNPQLAEQPIAIPSCPGSTSAESAFCDWNSHHSSELESLRQSKSSSGSESDIHGSSSKAISDSDVESHLTTEPDSLRSSNGTRRCNASEPIQLPQNVLPHLRMMVPQEGMSPLTMNPPEPYQLLATTDPNWQAPVHNSSHREHHNDLTYNVDPDNMPLLRTSSPRCTLSPYPDLATPLLNTNRFDTVKNSLRRAIHNVASRRLFLSEPKAVLAAVKRKGRRMYERLVLKMGIDQITNYETLSKEWVV